MNLVINSQFRPFTYDEMVKPLVQYKEVYDKLEQDYSDLAYQTEQWKNIADRENNPIAYGMYNKYATDLAAITEDFSKGMNVSNRRALLGMKRRYASDIEPIAKASKKIDELSAEQRKLSASNPNLMFDRDFSSEVSIDQMMENPNLSYRAIDGSDIYAKGAAISKAMSSRMHNISPALKGQYWEIRKGFGEDAANKFLLDSGAIPELNKALEDLVATTNAPDKLKSRVFEYAKQGAISGMVGDVSYQTNRAYESPADAAKRRDAHMATMMQLGQIPYREDSDGTKYYGNMSFNTTWSVDKEGNITEGTIPSRRASSKQDAPEQIKSRLVPDTGIGGNVLYDPQHPDHKYEIDENGNPVRLSKEMLTAKGKSSSVRINGYLNRNSSSPNPSEVIMFSVDGKGNLSRLTRENNLDDYNNMYNNINDRVVKDASEYFNGNLSSKAAKALKAELETKGLNLEDIEIVSDVNSKGVFSNERILVRTKSNNSSNRANVSSR